MNETSLPTSYTPEGLVEQIEKLSSRRAKATVLTRRLTYKYLGKAYGLAVQLKASPAAQVLFRKTIGNPKAGFKTELKTFSHVVRFVFEELGRKSASDYALVLAEARHEGQVEITVADWIEDSGGITDVLEKRRKRLNGNAKNNQNAVVPGKDDDASAEASCPFVLDLPSGAQIRPGHYTAVIEVTTTTVKVTSWSASAELVNRTRQKLAELMTKKMQEKARRQKARQSSDFGKAA